MFKLVLVEEGPKQTLNGDDSQHAFADSANALHLDCGTPLVLCVGLCHI